METEMPDFPTIYIYTHEWNPHPISYTWSLKNIVHYREYPGGKGGGGGGGGGGGTFVVMRMQRSSVLFFAKIKYTYTYQIWA